MALGNKKQVTSSDFDFKLHLYFGFFIRFALVMYGDHHDKMNALKYTDVDYHVFTDAARLIGDGKSPFDRHTYRYTPYLAFALLPNIKHHFLFGKFLFCCMDLIATKLMYSILLLEGHSKKVSGWASLLWLYNPLVIAISTRGNADSIMAVLIMILVYFLKIRLPILSGIALGLAVHFKLYPIIYILPIYCSFTPRFDSNSLLKKIMPNLNKLRFLGGAAVSFFTLTGFGYALYGDQYIEEAFLYHLNRTDTRHNFSIYFYLLYLCAERHIPALSIATFAPQMILVFACGFKYCSYRDLSFAFFTQTVVFVTFNKVVTSQYFLWYLMFLPLIAPRIKFSKRKAIFLFLLWIGAQASWLLPAYLLEYHAMNSFLPIWLESIAFFCCNVGILMAFIKAYPETPPLVAHHTTRKNLKRE